MGILGAAFEARQRAAQAAAALSAERESAGLCVMCGAEPRGPMGVGVGCTATTAAGMTPVVGSGRGSRPERNQGRWQGRGYRA